MKKMQTLTVNGNTYQVSDSGAVSFAEPQQLTDEQKQQAKQNLGMGGQYELIETVILDEAVSSFNRTDTPNARPYHFSAVRMHITVPAQESATNSDTLTFYLRGAGKAVVYHQQGETLNNKKTAFLARNDGGFTEHYAASVQGNTSAPMRMSHSYLTAQWNNIDRITLNVVTSKENVFLPAGTQIEIYGIWG